MKALTFTGIQSITYEDIPDPIIEDQMDVIVKTSYCAICGSDLHIYHGRERGIDSHTAMGHEFTGEVVEAGSEVTSLKLGDQVVSAFTTACGPVSYTHLRAHETPEHLVCRLLLEKKKTRTTNYTLRRHHYTLASTTTYTPVS